MSIIRAGVCYIEKQNIVHNLHVTSVHGMKTSSVLFILPFC